MLRLKHLAALLSNIGRAELARVLYFKQTMLVKATRAEHSYSVSLWDMEQLFYKRSSTLPYNQ